MDDRVVDYHVVQLQIEHGEHEVLDEVSVVSVGADGRWPSWRWDRCASFIEQSALVSIEGHEATVSANAGCRAPCRSTVRGVPLALSDSSRADYERSHLSRGAWIGSSVRVIISAC